MSQFGKKCLVSGYHLSASLELRVVSIDAITAKRQKARTLKALFSIMNMNLRFPIPPSVAPSMTSASMSR